MKQILSIIFIALAFGASAQSALPRYSNAKGGDNSGAFENHYFYAVSDTAGATVDTTRLSPRHSNIDVTVAMTDSVCLAFKTLKGCYLNDELALWITGQATNTGQFVYLSGNWVVSTGTAKIAITANKKSIIRFRFDGTKWVETSRNLNY